MKPLFLFQALFFLYISASPQKTDSTALMPYSSALKLNLNSMLGDGYGIRIAYEQKLTKKFSLQLELGKMLVGDGFSISPQLRYYVSGTKAGNCYFGIGYFYKQNEYHYSDSSDVWSPSNSEIKDFLISKYINAFTLNSGYIFKWYITRKFWVLTDFTGGLGVRFKKSSRYNAEGLDPALVDAEFVREAYVYDSHGKTKIYPELSLILRIVVPLVR